MQRALRRIAERAGVSFPREIYPASSIYRGGCRVQGIRQARPRAGDHLKASSGQDAGSWRKAER